MTLHNVALGNENKTTKIFQPNPEKSYFRTGLSSIANQDTDLKKGITYDIEMKKGSSLLENLHEIQYIKMDIEGYEKIVLQELEGIIKKYQPIVQVEIWKETGMRCFY
ncbi:MAG: FkbM family methyltransferase [Saprospiraceae bacterium]|nr:FkbM family methyltransferase [Saprospiraceae bacterium]